MTTSTPPAPLSPSKPSPPIPRAGTFRAPRPVSTGPGGLRRGATFANRPQSVAITDASSSVVEPEHVDSVPRLRRGSSFIGRPQTEPTDDSPVPLLRRGSRRSSVASPPQITPGEGLVPATKRLSRAGTFSYAPSNGRISSETLDMPTAVGKVAIQSIGSEDIGASEHLKGASGSSGIPLWTPERLRTMSDEEKEKIGRLETENRRKRMKGSALGVERLESEVEVVDTDGELETYKSESATTTLVASEEFDELESVDLATVASGRSSSKSSRRRSRSGSRNDEEEFGEDISAAVASRKGKRGHVLEGDCTQCEDLEGKVKDLEEQLAILKEVVDLCTDADDKERREEVKKPKTWKDKVISAYFGGGAASSEKAKLKQEVEALRKATDFLFRKLQQTE